MKKRYLIIGGGIAGTVAAEKLRAGDGSANITILEQEPNRVYNKTLLSNILLGRIRPESVFVRSEDWYNRQRIKLLTSTSVTALDREGKKVITSAGLELEYDVLVVAAGGESKKIPELFEGVDEVYSFRTYDDAVVLRDKFSSSRNHIILGGGFIGLELLLASHIYQGKSYLILREDSLWDRSVHPAGAELLLEKVEKYGTKVYKNAEVRGVKVVAQSGVSLGLSSGEELRGEVVVMGLGLDSRPAWLMDAGLVGDYGVRCNEFLQTDDPNIYACGDCAEYLSVTGYRYIGNWQNAVASGAWVAQNILGKPKSYRRLTSYRMEFYDYTIAFYGDTNALHADRLDDGQEGGCFVRKFYKGDALIGLSSIGEKLPPHALVATLQV